MLDSMRVLTDHSKLPPKLYVQAGGEASSGGSGGPQIMNPKAAVDMEATQAMLNKQREDIAKMITAKDEVPEGLS